MTRLPILILLGCAGTLGLGACAATLPTAATSTPAESAPAPAAPVAPATPADAEFSAAARALDGDVRRHVAEHGLARDGWLHGMDVATLLLYAAQRGDAELYGRVMPAALELIQQNPDDPYTSGFVLQRTKDGARPDASGAAETLWMARALWTGASAFKRDADRALALTLLDGYARHAYTLQEVWLVRNSFDFRTRSFSGLSSLPAYHGDFLDDARRSVRGAAWSGFADKSFALIEQAVTPSGLLLPVIQPEVGATYPGTGLEIYAPNNLTSLEQSCLGAEGAARTLSKIASGVVGFAVAQARTGTLRAFYNTEDGSPDAGLPLSAAGHACLDRLAAALGRTEALAVLDPAVTSAMRALRKTRAQLPSAGPLLLAAQARGAL